MYYSHIWSMFYSSVVSMQFHPGTKEPLDMAECARMADAMFEEFLKREVVWRGSDLQ